MNRSSWWVVDCISQVLGCLLDAIVGNCPKSCSSLKIIIDTFWYNFHKGTFINLHSPVLQFGQDLNDTVDGSEIPRPTTVWMYPKPCKQWDKIPFPQLVSLPDSSINSMTTKLSIIYLSMFLFPPSHGHFFFSANPWDASLKYLTVDFTKIYRKIWSLDFVFAPKIRVFLYNIQILVVIRNPVEVIFCRMLLEKIDKKGSCSQTSKQIFRKIGYPLCHTALAIHIASPASCLVVDVVLCSDSKPMLKSTFDAWVGFWRVPWKRRSGAFFLLGWSKKFQARTKSQDGSTTRTTFVLNGGYNPYKWPYRWVTGGSNHFKFVRVNALSYSK